MSPRSPSIPGNDGTRVDLGEDLLEATRELEVEASASGEAAEPAADLPPDLQSDEELQSAQILMGEGLRDEAKAALRRSLRLHPANILARRMLEEIQQKEFAELLARPPSVAPPGAVDEDIATIIQSLDDDFALGLDEERASGGSLLASSESHAELASSVAAQSAAMTLRERADLAVGFLQMEMPAIAVSLLEPASTLAGGFLAVYCWALLQARRALDCASVLEQRLRDEGIEGDVRRELEYLLSRAREELGDVDPAIELYRLLGDYRDSVARLSRLRSRPGRG